MYSLKKTFFIGYLGDILLSMTTYLLNPQTTKNTQHFNTIDFWL